MKTLLDMTAAASALIVCAVVVRALFINRLPKRTFTALWLIAALRLLVPFSLTLPVSAPLSGAVGQAVYAVLEADGDATARAENTGRAATGQAEVTASAATLAVEETDTISAVQTLLDKDRLAALLWGVGAALSMGAFLLCHWRCKRRYREAIPAACPAIDGLVRGAGLRRTVRVLVCQTLATPLTFGLFRPIILLPKSLDLDDTDRLAYILAHELVHIKRLHVLYKYVLTLAVCVHWFNPLAWVMYALAGRDLELACDQAVLRLSQGDRRAYALTLIAMEEKRGLSPLFSGFCASAVEERIRSIMKFKKTSIISTVLAVVLVLGATSVFAASESQEAASTSAQSDGPIQYICEPAYYTADQFRAAMAEEKSAIEAEVTVGTLDRNAADEILRDIDKWIQEAENGAQFQCPSPVYYADGSPVVNSQGEQLYAKASDIEECNRELLNQYLNIGEATFKAEETDVVADLPLSDADGAPDWESDTYLNAALDAAEDEDGIHWYTYEEYAQYIQEMKPAFAEMEGQWAFSTTDGWYEWTAADTAQAVADMEQALEDIKNGYRVGVTADGGIMYTSYAEAGDAVYTEADVAYAIDSVTVTAAESTSTAYYTYETAVEQAEDSAYTEADVMADIAQSTAVESGHQVFDGQDLADYFAYGVSADMENQYYLYDGKPVAGIVDKGRYVMTDGWAKEAGGIYVTAERGLLGKLTGLREISLEEFCELTGLTM